MSFSSTTQSICWLGSSNRRAYPNGALVPVGHTTTFFLLFLAVCSASTISVSWDANVLWIASSFYLTCSSVTWHYLLIRDQHLVLNFSNRSLGLYSLPVILYFILILSSLVSHTLLLSGLLESWFVLAMELFASIATCAIAAAHLTRFTTLGFAEVATPPRIVGFIYMLFWGSDSNFQAVRERYVLMYAVEGWVHEALQCVLWMVSSLFNAPIYLYFRHNNTTQLYTKNRLRCQGWGSIKCPPSTVPFWNSWSRNRVSLDSPPCNDPDYLTRLLDIVTGELVDGILSGTTNIMLINGSPTPFVAISHTWAATGSFTKQEWILSLRRCLKYGMERTNCYCWIDNLCVNQQDSQEVSAAVRAMGRLYSNSDLVLIHDLSVTNVEAILYWVSRYTSGTALSLLCAYVTGRRCYTSQFRSHPWFGRIWTFQEAILPHKLVVWSPMGLLIPLVQILVAQTTFCLDTAIPEPTITQELFDEHSDSAVLAAAQKRTATRLNDQIYGIFGLMPKHLVQDIDVSYERPFSGLFLELLLGLIRSGDHSMLGCAQSLSVENEGIPRWLPGFGNIKPLKGPCKQPGKSQITAQGLQVSVFVLGCVENCTRLTEVDFGQSRFSELGAEASLAMNDLHFTGGVWDQRKTYKGDYDGEYLREMKRMVLEEAEERGGLWEIQLQVVDSGDIKIMLAWAPEEIPKQALAIVRCLDKDPGSIGLVTQYPNGWVTVGGLFGGLDKGCEALPKKDILLRN